MRGLRPGDLPTRHLDSLPGSWAACCEDGGIAPAYGDEVAQRPACAGTDLGRNGRS